MSLLKEVINNNPDFSGETAHFWAQLLLRNHKGYDYSPKEVLEDIQVVRKGENAVVSLTFTEPYEKWTTELTISRSFEVDLSRLGSIRHDLVAEALCEDHTDIKLSNVYGIVGEREDDLTPDFHLETEDFHIICELGTANVSSTNILKRHFQKKYITYLEPLEKRSSLLEKPTAYVIVIVGNGTVVSNIQLTQETVEELCLRMCIGKAIENKAFEKEIIQKEDDSSVDKEMTAILSMLKDFPLIAPQGDNLMDGKFIKFARELRPDKTVNNRILRSMLIKKMEEASKFKSTTLEEIEKKEKELQEPGRRIVNKAICQIPLVLPEEKAGVNVQLPFFEVKEDSPAVLKLWKIASDKKYEMLDKWHDEEYNDVRSKALEESNSFERLNKRTWHRLNVGTLPSEVEAQLQLDGLWAKKGKQELHVQAKREETKKLFGMNCPTLDIDEFLKTPVNDDGLFLPTNVEKAIELLQHASETWDYTEMANSCFDECFRYDLVKALLLVSSIGAELTISLKQNVSNKEFILKKIRDYNCHILIHPTNSTSHVFFSIMVEGRVLENSVFRNMHNVRDDLYVSDMLSSNLSRVENLILSPYIFLATLMHWHVITNIPRETPSAEDLFLDQESVSVAKLAVVIAIEDRATTEKVFTEARYLITEALKGPDERAQMDLGLKIKKFETNARSRLHVWALKKLFNYARIAEEAPPVPTGNVDLENQDVWMGLFNPYTGNVVNNARCIVDLYYLGYAKNKNAEEYDNSTYHLIDKVLTHIFDGHVNKEPVYSGYERPDPFSVGPHEWDSHFLAEGCDLLSEHLESVEGKGFQKIMERRVLQNLSEAMTYTKLATFKASSTVSGEDRKCSRGGPTVESQKCIAAVVKELLEDPELKPIRRLKTLVTQVVAEYNGVVCHIFKKKQHGGIREIYVLTMKCRIIQLYLETISRTICEFVPFETMTHPENKTRLVDDHLQYLTNRELPQMHSVITRGSSEDKSKWSQNLHVKCLAFMLIRILPESFHNSVVSCLNLWLRKKMLIPKAIQKCLIEKTKLGFDSYDKLKAAFYGDAIPGQDIPYLNRIFELSQDKFVTLEFGMWQGILHYTSSLLHVCQSLHYKRFCSRVLTDFRNHANEHEDVQPSEGWTSFKVTTLVSSDDSMSLISGLISKDKENTYIGQLADSIIAMLLKLEGDHSSLFNMIPSPKSVVASSTVFEFNSNFFYKGTLLNPTLKFQFAALSLTESETFTRRQEIACNGIKSILENGGTTYECNFTQLLQGMVYYGSMGMYSSCLFPEWADMLIQVPSPALGFFAMGHPLLSVGAGFQHLHWKLATTHDIPINLTLKSLGDLDITDKVSMQVNLRYGERKKQARLLEKVELEGWRDIVQDNPKILYKKTPESVEEVRVRLSASAGSLGAYEAMRGGGRLTNMYSSSVYVLQFPCISTGYIESENPEEGPAVGKIKVSLFKLTKDTVENLKDILSSQDTDSDILNIAFPNADLYAKLEEKMEDLKGAVFVGGAKRRVRYNKIHIFSPNWGRNIPLMDVVRDKWFGIRSKFNRTTIDRMYSRFQKVFSWLKDTPEASLEESKFENHVQLFNFINSMHEKLSTIRPICAKLKTITTVDQLHELARVHYLPSIELVSRAEEERDESVDKGKIFLDLMSQLPIPDTLKTTIAQTLEDEIPDFNLDYAVSQGTTGNTIPLIYYIQKNKRTITPQEALHAILKTRKGELIYYKSPQNYDVRRQEYVGPGILEYVTANFRAEVYVYDQTVMSIQTNDIDSLRSHHGELWAKLQESGITEIETGYASSISHFVNYGNQAEAAKETDFQFTANKVARVVDRAVMIGCTIWRTERLTMREIGDIVDLNALSLVYERGQIKLIMTARTRLEGRGRRPLVKTKKHAILIYSPEKYLKSTTEIDFACRAMVGKQLGPWLELKSCPLAQARDLLSSAMTDSELDDTEDPSYDAKKKRWEWVKSTLKTRARVMSLIIGSSMLPKSIEAAQDVSLVEMDIYGLVNIGAMLKDKKWDEPISGLTDSGHFDFDGLLDICPSWFSSEPFSFSKPEDRTISATRETMYMVHPFWDELLSMFTEIHLFEKIAGKEQMSGSEEDFVRRCGRFMGLEITEYRHTGAIEFLSSARYEPPDFELVEEENEFERSFVEEEEILDESMD